jgi:(R,R)-butanediol dehydrogenase/meso-butanediol dehydrogenase/diacetyl reductase
MRAVAYVGDDTIRVQEREPLEPAPGQVRLDVAYVGICGTDLHIKHGAMDARVTLPAVIGHEMSGTVAAVGEDVTEWTQGDRVTVMPLRWCGDCAACRAGHRHVCQRLVFVGIDSPGALQQSWTVDQDLVVRLPERLPLDQAALAEPVAVAVHDVRRAGLAAGGRALVVGGGPIGLLIALVAASEGIDVVISEPNAFRRTVAEQVGLRTIDPIAEDVTSALDDWTDAPGSMSPSRCPAAVPDWRPPPTRCACAAASSWSRSTANRCPSTCSGCSGASSRCPERACTSARTSNERSSCWLRAPSPRRR